MKELSIEQKAKAYDEALERAKIYYTDGNEDMKMMMKTCFPILVEESEDEKIRKAIHIYLDWLDGRKDCVPSGEYSIRDMIAWLEKQKEYESTDFDYVWEATECSELTSALDKYSEDAIKKVCHAWYDKGIELERKKWLEKQGQTFNKKDVDDAYLKGLCDAKQELEKQGEQKPAWSEEDDEMINNIIDYMKPMSTFFVSTKGKSGKEYTKEFIKQATTWLKSIKDRLE